MNDSYWATVEESFDYRQTTMTAEEYCAALFLDSIQEEVHAN